MNAAACFRPTLFALTAAVAFVGCSQPPEERLALGCRHEYDCSDFATARKQLLVKPRTEYDPYASEAGTCGVFKYLKHREERVPTDQQESTIVVRYYDSGGTLFAARVAENRDSSESFKSHKDYGQVPSCTRSRSEVLNAAKEPLKR